MFDHAWQIFHLPGILNWKKKLVKPFAVFALLKSFISILCQMLLEITQEQLPEAKHSCGQCSVLNYT